MILLISSFAFLTTIRSLLSEIYHNMPVTTDYRDGYGASYPINDEETAVKIAQVIIEKKLGKKIDIGNISAKSKEKDGTDDIWEFVFSDAKDTVTLCMKKLDAEVISISVE